MVAAGERARLELRGLRPRRKVLAAVLALNGSKPAQLTRASALAAMVADRCILVAVDGGARTCRAAGRRPDLFVGDGDSVRRVPADMETVLYSRDKDFSDLAGALEEVRRRKMQVVAVAGLLGGRLDHEWANLLEVGRRARAFAGILAPGERATVVVTSHGCRAATVRGQPFSLFSLGAAATVSLFGPKWELERVRLVPGSRGLSNVGGTEIDLTVHAGTVALVLLPPPRRSRRGSR